jgi:hypothetical protein
MAVAKTSFYGTVRVKFIATFTTDVLAAEACVKEKMGSDPMFWRFWQISGKHFAALRLQNSFGGRRKFGKLRCGASGTYNQFTTAIGAMARQRAFCAGGTKSALERADAGIGGIRRQVLVAALAAGA